MALLSPCSKARMWRTLAQEWAVNLFRDGIVKNAPGLLQAVQGIVIRHEAAIGDTIVRSKSHRSAGRSNCLVVLPHQGVVDTQVVIRRGRSRVSLDALLVYLIGLSQLASDIAVVHGFDVKALTLAGAVAQCKCLLGILDCQAGLSQVAKANSEVGVGHGEVRIQLDGALVMRKGRGIAFFCSDPLRLCQRLQSFQRGCRGVEWRAPRGELVVALPRTPSACL